MFLLSVLDRLSVMTAGQTIPWVMYFSNGDSSGGETIQIQAPMMAEQLNETQ